MKREIFHHGRQTEKTSFCVSLFFITQVNAQGKLAVTKGKKQYKELTKYKKSV